MSRLAMYPFRYGGIVPKVPDKPEIVLVIEVITPTTLIVDTLCNAGDRLNGTKVEGCQENGMGWLVTLNLETKQKFVEGQFLTRVPKVVEIKSELSELPEPYSRLAWRRIDLEPTEANLRKPLDMLFDFSKTPEGHDWWWKVSFGERPEIPAQSLKELETEFVTSNLI